MDCRKLGYFYERNKLVNFFANAINLLASKIYENSLSYYKRDLTKAKFIDCFCGV